MSESVRAVHTFEVKGKSHTLRFDFNAICDIEEKANMGIAEMTSEKRIGFNTIRLMVWGGLKWKNPGLTIQQAGFIVRDYMDEDGDIEALFNTIVELVSKSVRFGKKKSDDGSGEEDDEELGKLKAGE